jgi:AcrR family transcriptional regulator
MQSLRRALDPPTLIGMDSPSAPFPGSDSDSSTTLPRAYAVRSERERMLEAMVRVAAGKGYQEATVDDVVAAADASRETFHETFGDKETCFLEAYEAVTDVLVAHVAAAYEGAAGRPWPERMAAALGALTRLLATESDIARMTMVEVTAVGEEARVRYRANLERFVPFLEDGREYSSRGDELPEDTARFAIGGVASLIFDEVRAGRGPELTAMLPQLTFAVLMPYIGAEAAEDEMRRLDESED